MPRAGDYAVVYDISSDRERARVDKILQGFGFRVQKSVFECMLTRKDRNQLVERLEKLELETGFVKIYRLIYSSKNSIIGRQEKPGIDHGAAFIV
jgi:CRISPR-associated protein Cas2